MFDAYVFEALMLIAFGCAWPVSIYKSLKAKVNHGKSIYFLYIILFGYLNGIIFQFMVAKEKHYVLILFFLNACMVVLDILIYYRNHYLHKHEVAIY